MVNRLPPRALRRLVLAPLMLAVSTVLLALSPALLLLAVLADLAIRKSWRTTRCVAFCVVYLAFEVTGLAAMLGLWLASGAGRRIRTPKVQEAHFRFIRWWLKGLYWVVGKVFGLRIHVEDRPQPRPGPVLVFSRHAGPGNSLMLVGTLMLGYHRRPRIVMLAKLQWEPLFDIMLNRVPNRFIRHDPARREMYLEAIADLASGLGDRDAFVLFPEGRNFTPRLRQRAIAHFRTRGHHEAADQAERMAHLLPPRPGGVMAAITAAPGADVVFVAHTVLEDVGSFGDLWSRIPLERPVVGRYWRIPAAEVPRERDELIAWLFAWWARIDGWIRERLAAPAAGTPGGPSVGRRSRGRRPTPRPS